MKRVKSRVPASLRAARRVFAAATLLALAASLQAAEVRYRHSGTGSGLLDGLSFEATRFTITALADTAGIASCGGACLFNPNLSATITIDGVGSFDFLAATRYFSNIGTVGFSRAGEGGLDLFDGPRLLDWDMKSSVGPVAGTGQLIQWGMDPVLTSGGVLYFDPGSSAARFTATVVPEPAAALLLGAGLFGLLASRLRAARQTG